jgi:predicted PurR-regulated permease PerM
MSRSVRMNPLWVLLSVLIGANLGGVFGSALGALTGALVAIPVGGAIQVIFREVWQHTQATEGLDEGPDAGGPERPGHPVPPANHAASATHSVPPRAG